MFLENYEEEKYETTFNSVYNSLKKERDKESKTEKIQKIEKLLTSLYVDQGNDWLGRGTIKDITNSATIAACEVVLSELKEGS